MFFVFHENEIRSDGKSVFKIRHVVEADTPEEAQKHPAITWAEDPVKWDMSFGSIVNFGYDMHIYLKTGETLTRVSKTVLE